MENSDPSEATLESYRQRKPEVANVLDKGKSESQVVKNRNGKTRTNRHVSTDYVGQVDCRTDEIGQVSVGR